MKSPIAILHTGLASAMDEANAAARASLAAFPSAVHSNAALTVSGSTIFQNIEGREVALIVNVKNAPTGVAPKLTFSLQEVDPGDLTTVIGTAVTGNVLTAIGTQILVYPDAHSHAIKVSWTVAGTAPSFTGVYATLRAKSINGQDSSLLSGGPPSTVFPFDVSRLVIARLLNVASPVMNVNGSVTPVVFSYPANATKDIYVSELRIYMSDNTVPYGDNKFGAGAALTNGVLIEVVSNGVTATMGNLKVNDDYALLTPVTTFNTDQVGANDWVAVGLNFANVLVLKAGTSDVIRITIRDNLTALNYFQASCSGVKAL